MKKQNNKFKFLFILTFFYSLIGYSQSKKENSIHNHLENYNVKWDSQSKNSSESMPLGGGDIGCNVWVEQGDILFYLSKSDAFDENNQLLKLGRGRIRLEPNIFADENCEFSQELKLSEGYIQITGKLGNDEVKLNLWVDVLKPQVNISLKSSSKVNVTAFYENWRTSDRLITMTDKNACFSYSGYTGDVITYADSIQYDENSIVWFHRNKPDKLLIDFSIEQQGLSHVKDKLINTQKDLTFGGVMIGKDMKPSRTGTGTYVDTPFKYWSITSKKPMKNHAIKVVLHTDQSESIDIWKKDLLSANLSFDTAKTWRKTKEWWSDFWNRSHIFINIDKNDPTDKGWQVGRNYQLFRYQLACNAYGNYPTKFNGGLFTYDPVFVKQYTKLNHGTPDYRTWGGGSFTAQNQRLVYWPMLKSGDFDMMPTQFDFYARSLKNAEIRTKEYWGHEGCSFTEHPETFGLPAAATWGFKEGRRTRNGTIEHGTLTNQWVRLHYTNQLEFSYMILKYYEYSGKDISKYIPFINSSLTFFFEHYKYRERKRTGKPYDKNNKLVIYPSTACETFKNIKNPTDISAALTAVIQSLKSLPETVLSKEKNTYWQEQLIHVPEMTYGIHNGKKILVAGKNLPKRINADMPEMYPVFPYGFYGVGLPNLEIALNTWNSGILDSRKDYISWHQDAIFSARMGLTEEAKRVTILKLQDSERRFPTFWGPGHDYVPDHNWGGSGMIGLQDMLLQYVKEDIFLCPAWPKDWDVQFKLRAPKSTIIEASFKNGEIENMDVSPSNRLKDVVVKN